MGNRDFSTVYQESCIKFSPSIDITKWYIVLNFGEIGRPSFEKNWVKFQNLPLYIRNGGQFGVKIFIPNRGPRGLIVETLGSGNFYKGGPL